MTEPAITGYAEEVDAFLKAHATGRPPPSRRGRAVAERFHASRNPHALLREPIPLEDHAASRMASDPFRLLDYGLETDGAMAVTVASAERARDLKQRPVYIMGTAQGGAGRWGQAIATMQMPDEIFATAGAGVVAKRRPALRRLHHRHDPHPRRSPHPRRRRKRITNS